MGSHEINFRANLYENLLEKGREARVSTSTQHQPLILQYKPSAWTDCLENFKRKFTRKMPRPRTATRGLCEPAQSKFTWTCNRNRFLRKFTGKLPRPRTATPVLREPAQRNAHGHVTRAVLSGNLEVKGHRRGRLCASLRCRNAHGHLTRAILEPFYTRIYRKLEEGWPESVEEQGLLLLVWRRHITKQYIKIPL